MSETNREKCPSTIKLALLKAVLDAPADKRADTIRLAAEVLAEATSQQPPVTDEDCLDVLGSAVPRPFPIGGVLPQAVRSVIDESLSLFRECHRTIATPTATETPEEREDREKSIILPSGIKVQKTATEPYTIFYPHLWLGVDVEVWFRNFATFTANHTIPDIHSMKLRRCEQGIRAWFTLIANVKNAQEFAPAHITIFYSFIDIIVELLLLIKHSGHRPSAPTLTFAASVELRRHSNRALDYFIDYSTARNAVEPPKNVFRL